MKKAILVIFSVLLVISCASILFACKNPQTDDNDKVVASDDDYTLTIQGLTANQNEAVVITKAQIKELYATKPVQYTEQNPVYASDKQLKDEDGELILDKDGNPQFIPHTLKGVYLDDLLSKYANGELSGSYSTMTLEADDGYLSILTGETFNEEQGGSKMIIAFEYDGISLNPKEKSGALRAVFADQVANSWAKFLKKITFSSEQLTLPDVGKFYTIAAILQQVDCLDSYTVFEDALNAQFTYSGISIAKLIENNVLTATAGDKMYITAWDYVFDGVNSYERGYVNWKNYDYYATSFLVLEQQKQDGEKQPRTHAPCFDGTNILSGMSVKNVLSISVGANAIVSLDIANQRFGTSGVLKAEDVLKHLGMNDDQANYRLNLSDEQRELSYEQLKELSFTGQGENYYVVGEEQSKLLYSIEKINK